MCIIHFEHPPFDVLFGNFRIANLFYIKRSFYSALTSPKLPLNYATIAWFSKYKNLPLRTVADLSFFLFIIAFFEILLVSMFIIQVPNRFNSELNRFTARGILCFIWLRK